MIIYSVEAEQRFWAYISRIHNQDFVCIHRTISNKKNAVFFAQFTYVSTSYVLQWPRYAPATALEILIVSYINFTS